MNIYVWNNEWLPWENTIAYYPLTSSSTTSDKSWNNRNLTNYNNVAFWTYAGVNCAYFAGNKMILYNSNFPARWTWKRTFSCWMYTTSNNYQTVIAMWNSESTSLFLVIKNGLIDGTSISVSLNQWHNIVYTVWNNTLKMYIDGVEQYSSSYTVSNTASIWLGRVTYAEDKNYLWYLSEVIIESKTWNQSEVLSYYNSTKSNYWL